MPESEFTGYPVLVCYRIPDIRYLLSDRITGYWGQILAILQFSIIQVFKSKTFLIISQYYFTRKNQYRWSFIYMLFVYFLGLQKNVSDCLLRRSACHDFTHRYVLGKEKISWFCFLTEEVMFAWKKNSRY